ncbi:uncharacterized protein BJ171DRAFT_596682 [Polychytrium aggregatum]|uniref:uncharacterized protein n=1 Tax=Polychytrium aggregatum TaxID=110093 RepID=UPI0022FE97EF|nr:uncharacterized protein BJ171DRAFT_603636 [Polychytrium aggregatum]XP_052969770.1 uncharacterized protein BJ171DRAFT_596682 [Polychytrium aggregatum]KAI9193442.1 hypothetical protein BJ171DRAFT_603636 [Polychytrium aggregatum]KAI9207690.1 hypothetical protein BJ171DRAFT_596682 [Polychytrium aggregatum]
MDPNLSAATSVLEQTEDYGGFPCFCSLLILMILERGHISTRLLENLLAYMIYSGCLGLTIQLSRLQSSIARKATWIMMGLSLGIYQVFIWTYYRLFDTCAWVLPNINTSIAIAVLDVFWIIVQLAVSIQLVRILNNLQARPSSPPDEAPSSTPGLLSAFRLSVARARGSVSGPLPDLPATLATSASPRPSQLLLQLQPSPQPPPSAMKAKLFRSQCRIILCSTLLGTFVYTIGLIELIMGMRLFYMFGVLQSFSELLLVITLIDPNRQPSPTARIDREIRPSPLIDERLDTAQTASAAPLMKQGVKTQQGV